MTQRRNGKISFFANLLDFATIERQSAFGFQSGEQLRNFELGTLNQEHFNPFRGAFRVAV